MAVQLHINGLEALRAALRRLPADLQREAAVIVQAQAEAAAASIVAAYPIRTGNLRSHVRVELGGDAVSASARVRNTARHAYLYEQGTAPRRWASGKSTGVMPAGKVFIPIAIYRRRIMIEALIDLVERAGLTVSRSAA